MNPLEAALRKAASDLDQRGCRWSIVGGFAVSARSNPRFTADIDIAAAVADDTQAEGLVQSLIAAGYQLFASVEHDNGRLATVRLKRRIDGVPVVVDLLFASSGIEPEIVRAAEPLEIFPGLIMPVARTGHLIALKLLARDDESRPQDSADLRSLAAVATMEDIADAAEAIRLITERGFNRDRDLAQLLAKMQRSLSDG